MEHFVVTRFSVRMNEYMSNFERASKFHHANPLKRSTLKRRIHLFSAICFPSLVHQSNQNFSWVILIDEALPKRFKDPLEALIRPHQNFHLHTFQVSDKIENTDWLIPYAQEKNPDYILTTMLDDDDAFPKDFVASVQSKACQVTHKKDQYIALLGSSDVIQWDMLSRDGYPYGFTSSWHRASIEVVSCGFSCLSKYPDMNFSIFIFRHFLGPHYFDWSKNSEHPSVRWVRENISNRLMKLGIAENSIRQQSFINCSGEGHPVCMTNHAYNAQVTRVLEKKKNVHKVIPHDSFSLFNFNWDLLLSRKEIFSPSQLQIIRITMIHKMKKMKNKYPFLKSLIQKIPMLDRYI